eukprot:3435665-Karenia_brevis.AAC.1
MERGVAMGCGQGVRQRYGTWGVATRCGKGCSKGAWQTVWQWCGKERGKGWGKCVAKGVANVWQGVLPRGVAK